MTEIQQNNPLHGLKLEVLLNELVEFYGWEVLGAVMKLNCFINKPSMEASLKFLRKTTWAREKVEAFYLYRFKNLPRPDDKQYALPPRDRTIPLEQQPRAPVELNVDIEPQPQLKAKPKPRPKVDWQSKAQKPAMPEKKSAFDPWSEARKKFE